MDLEVADAREGIRPEGRARDGQSRAGGTTAGLPRRAALNGDGDGRPPDGEHLYRRYAIVDEAMHREAAAKLDAWAVEQKAKANAERKGQLRRFKKRRAS